MPQSLHHAWLPITTHGPRIVSITAMRGPHLHSLARIVSPMWIFDYEWSPYGTIGLASPHQPDLVWRPRPRRTMHLYPAHIEFWEDVRHQKGERDSAWIFFDDDSNSLLNLVHPDLRYRRINDPTGLLGDWFRQLSDLGQSRGNAALWHANALLYRLIDAATNSQFIDDQTLSYDPTSDARQTTPPLLRQVEQFLKPRLAERIKVSDIANHLHMSESSLSHRLREEAGITPMNLLTRLRVDQATSLLVRGVPLKSIAPALGFCDEFHLSRTIKRLEGKTPRQLRMASK